MNRAPSEQGRPGRRLSLAAPTLVLLAAAIGLRLTASRVFYGIETEQVSAHALAEDVPRLSTVLWTAFKALSRTYARGHLLPAYVLLLPGVLLLALRMSRARDQGARRLGPGGHSSESLASERPGQEQPGFLGSPTSQRRFLVAVFVAAFMAVTAVHFLLIRGYPQISDEHSYIFQADLLASGKLYTESPPEPQFFQTLNVINNGKWYSRYTLGWPLLLALGRAARMDFAVNAACAALSLVVLYLIGKRLLGRAGGALSVFFAGLSPFFILQAGTYFPHAASGLFALLYAYCLLVAFQDGGWRHLVCAGLCLAYLVQIRPQDGALILAGTLPLTLYCALRGDQARMGADGRALAKIALILAFFALGVGALLLVNRAQTGQAGLFAFLKYEPTEKWGFGTLGHSPLRGLWNAAYTFMRAGFWSVPFLGLFALVAVIRRQVAALLVLPAVVFAVFYFFYYDLGGIDMGVRFYLPALLLLCVPAAGGVLAVKEMWRRAERPGAAEFIPSLACMLALFMAAAVFPGIFAEIGPRFQHSTDLYAQTTRPSGVQGRSIIFLGEDPERKNNVFTRNSWQYDRQANLMVFYLTPRENLELIRRFPDRRPYLVFFNAETRRYEIVPDVDNSETARNYLVAARNYRYGVKDARRAETAYIRSLELDQYNLNTIVELGGLYVSHKEYEQAVPIYRAVAASGQYPAVQYLLGRVLGEMGNTDEAIRVLDAFADSWQEDALKARAEGWIEYYRSRASTTSE